MTAIFIFVFLVGLLLWLSWYLGKKAKSADSFFVAGGQIHWFVNGIALTGGYLSAASFLGICGMIAFKGFDGYLYSIGFLSGWVVALFVVAEPMRRLGKYTFADALGARFRSPSIHLAASISTLAICVCYLVPQMVAAGALIEPLMGISHHWGVLLVGAVVIVVVTSAGMSSTTYVQFIQAGMLLGFSAILVVSVLGRGLQSDPQARDFRGEAMPRYRFRTLPVRTDRPWEENLEGTPYDFVDSVALTDETTGQLQQTWVLLEKWLPLTIGDDGISYHTTRRDRRLLVARDPEGVIAEMTGGRRRHDRPPPGRTDKELQLRELRITERDGAAFVRIENWYLMESGPDDSATLVEAQSVERLAGGRLSVNGLPADAENAVLPMGRIAAFGQRSGHDGQEGPLGPFKFLSVFADPETAVEVPRTRRIVYGDRAITLYYHATVAGNELMRPGGHFDLAHSGPWARLDFISLMIGLFFGTTALPHVLIRYYTVRDSHAAHKSTIVAITTIGFFYILTLFLGLGALAGGNLNPQTQNMSAPLLARAFGELLFAIITALAFTTVLATVAGLIVAASGAVANDLLDRYMRLSMTERGKVVAARITAVSVGLVSVVLGILFRGVNVGFLVGWAFAVAASANFPAIIMVLFWKRTTPQGIVASILVGIVASLGIILMGPDMFEHYGYARSAAWAPLGQPAVVSMPLSFVTLVAVSLLTQKRNSMNQPAGEAGE